MVHCLLVDLRDLRDLREEMFELAELSAFYSPGGVRREVTVGRDPACDIVIDHPAVEPHHAWLSAVSNHRMLRLAGEEARLAGAGARAAPRVKPEAGAPQRDQPQVGPAITRSHAGGSADVAASSASPIPAAPWTSPCRVSPLAR